MKNYFIFFLLLIFSSEALFSSPFGGGTGTSSDPYQLWTKGHLEELADSTFSDVYKLPCWHCDKHFRLMQDIDDVIRCIWGTFKGYFQGGEKKIIVAMTYDPNILYSNTTLFGGVGGTINSLILDGYIEVVIAGITVSVATSYGYPTASISNCINNINIDVPMGVDPWGNPQVIPGGGIASQNLGGLISNCINNGSVSGVDYVGGIAGQNSTGTISNCINTGKISASNSGSGRDIHGIIRYGGVGGIAAHHQYSILNCINLGDISGKYNVGGIVAYASHLSNKASLIANSVNSGYIKGEEGVGGILGYMLTYGAGVTISNCVNTGVIEGEEDVGAIVGKEE